MLNIEPIDKIEFQTMFSNAQKLRDLDEQEYERAISEGGTDGHHTFSRRKTDLVSTG